MAFAARLIEKEAARVGWESLPSDGHLGKMKRTTLIGLISIFSQDPAHVAEARRRLDALLANVDDASTCPTDYRVSVLQMVLRAGGEKEYADVMRLYDRVRTEAEKRQIMGSLGHTPLPHLKQRTLDWATSGAVKTQDFFFVLRSVSGSSQQGLEQTWRYFKDNFNRIHAMVSSAPSSLMVHAINASCDEFTTDERADEIAAFFAAHPLPECSMKIGQLIETVRVAAAVSKRMAASPLADASFWNLDTLLSS